jgi:pimeloyl-ACP methyl ester carboxylesterase
VSEALREIAPAAAGAIRLPDPSPYEEFKLPWEDVEAGSIALRCFRFPEGIVDRSRAVVCLPGMSAAGPSFARLRPLAGRFDLRLLSGPVDSYPGGSIRPFVAAVEEYLESLDRPVLLGTSFGGLLAIEVAHHLGKRLSGLILTAAFARNKAIPRWLLPLEKLLPVLQWAAPAVAPISARIVVGHSDEEARLELVREALQISVSERRRRLREIFTTDIRAILPDVGVPALVIHGTRDHLASLADARELAKLLPLASYHEIEGAGHTPYLSHASEFNAIIEPFLEERLSR